MSPSFVLLHTESQNPDRDSVCNIVLVPVIDGALQTPVNFVVNPETHYEMVCSGLSRDFIEQSPKLTEVWPQIEQILRSCPVVVSSSDGNAARTLCGTLNRLGIDYAPIEYVNAKALCRRGMDEVSYSLDYLSGKLFGDSIPETEPGMIARRWAELALKGVEGSDAADIKRFAEANRIKPGLLSPIGLKPSECIRDYAARKAKALEIANTAVNADPENPFFGMTVVFTGKMESMSRAEARAAVISIGGDSPDTLKKDTNYLVVGKQDMRVVGEKGLSGKMKKAADYRSKGADIEIIDESDFLEMIGAENVFMTMKPNI